MRIEIDTKEDSHETIRKAIDLLKSIVGESGYSNAGSGSIDIFGNSLPSAPAETASTPGTPSSSGGGLFGNLFGSPSSSETTTTEPEATEETKEEEEVPEIIPY